MPHTALKPDQMCQQLRVKQRSRFCDAQGLCVNRTVRLSSAKPSKSMARSEKKSKPEYSWPWPTESGFRLVRRNSVAVTSDCALAAVAVRRSASRADDGVQDATLSLVSCPPHVSHQPDTMKGSWALAWPVSGGTPWRAAHIDDGDEESEDVQEHVPLHQHVLAPPAGEEELAGRQRIFVMLVH